MKFIYLIALASVLTQPAFAAKTAADDFVFVAPDAVLKNVGQTREQFNKQSPAAEKKWREAWKVEGTKNDNSVFKLIRSQTTKPKD